MRNALTLSALLLLPCLAAAQDAAGSRGPRRVAILLFPGVELLDFSGPGEVFAAARGAGGGRAFEVFTVAETAAPLRSQGFLDITPRYTLQDCPAPDVVVVPGGGVPVGRPEVVRWLAAVGERAEVVLSVCNGAMLLAKAGMLDGLHATTHHGSIESLMLAAPNTTVHDDRRFVDNGRIVTAAGVSAGIDGALHVVARLLGADAARGTARYMEYRWEPENAHEYQQRAAGGGERSAELRIVRALLADGADAARALWKELPAPPSEAALNRAGYALLHSGGQTDEAVAVFELIAAAFPESANAQDSLADGLLAAGRRDEAAACARRCLQLLEGDSTLDAPWRERVRESAEQKLRPVDPAAAGSWKCPPCGADCHERTYDRPGQCAVCGMALITVAEYETAEKRLQSGEGDRR